MSTAVEDTNRSYLNLGSAGDLGTGSVDTIEELTKEVEALKKKLEEERAKFNDVARELILDLTESKYFIFQTIFLC